MTLIELMVVVIVMAVMAGAIVPNLAAAARRGGVDKAAGRIVDVLDFAARAAVARRRTVVVNLDGERGRCWATLQTVRLPWLEDEDAPETRTLTAVRLPEDLSLAVYRESTETAFGADEAWERVTFRPDGTTEDVTVELVDGRGRARSIEVSGITGRADLLEGEE